MTDSQSQDDARTAFDFDPRDRSPDADVWVDDTFVNEYNDERAVLDGDTYEAKNIIKFDWDVTHHDFNDQRKAWIVDADALDLLGEQLAEAGFSFDAESRDGPRDDPLFDLHAYAEDGDDITIVYEQKNGEGKNHKEGEVVGVDYNSGYEDKPKVEFRRHDDDQFMYVQFDKWGKVSLYTGGSTSPFVGAVTQAVVHSDEDRGVSVDEADEPAEEEPAADKPLPWEAA